MPRFNNEDKDRAIALLEKYIALLEGDPTLWQPMHDICQTALGLNMFRVSHDSISKLVEINNTRLFADDVRKNAARRSELCAEMLPLAEQLLEYLRNMAV